MEAKDIKNLKDDELIKAVNFAMEKFLLRSEMIASEGKILDNELHELKTKVQINKINSVIQNI